MKQNLPHRNFEWIDTDKFILENVTEDSDDGYILEVDLEYPEELHDLHNDYPYCPEHCEITPEMVSDYSRGIGEAMEYNVVHLIN